MIFKINVKMFLHNVFLCLALLQITHEQLLPPMDSTLFGNQQDDDFQTDAKDPVVGMGLGLPMLRAATLLPRAKIGAAHSLAQAYALALKARADAQHRIIDNQLRYELATAKARMPGLPGLHNLPLTPRFKLPGNPLLGSPQHSIDNEFDGTTSFNEFEDGGMRDQFSNDPTSSFTNNQRDFGIDQDMNEDLRSLLNGGGLFDRNVDRRHAYDYLPENHYQEGKREYHQEDSDAARDERIFRRDMERLGVPIHEIFRRDLVNLGVPTREVFRRNVEMDVVPKFVEEKTVGDFSSKVNNQNNEESQNLEEIKNNDKSAVGSKNNVFPLQTPTNDSELKVNSSHDVDALKRNQRDVDEALKPNPNIPEIEQQKGDGEALGSTSKFKAAQESNRNQNLKNLEKRNANDTKTISDVRKKPLKDMFDDSKHHQNINEEDLEQVNQNQEVGVDINRGELEKSALSTDQFQPDDSSKHNFNQIKDLGQPDENQKVGVDGPKIDGEENDVSKFEKSNESAFPREQFKLGDSSKNDFNHIKDVEQPNEVDDSSKNNFDHKIRARQADIHNLKRDEELFIQSLNNINAGNNFMRDAETQNPCNDFLQIAGDRNFWDDHDIFYGTAPPRNENPPVDREFGHETQSENGATYAHAKRIEEESNSEFHPNNPSEGLRSSRHFDLFGKHKHPLFHDSIFNKHQKHLGGDSQFDQGFSHQNFGNHESSQFTQPIPSYIQQFQHGNNNPGIPQTIPSHVTINNHQNTFTNAVNANGLRDLRITQASGSIAESQASSTNINQFLRSPNNHQETPDATTRENPEFLEANEKYINLNNPQLGEGSDYFNHQYFHSGINDIYSNNPQFLEFEVQNYGNNPQILANEHLFRSDNSHFATTNDQLPNSNFFQPGEEVVTSPYLLHFPYRRLSFPKDQYQRRKRSLPLVRLIADPNTKLDMTKTLENVGSIAKKSFEDKRAPMYHVKNMLGSTKDAFLSTLKIPPQDIIIPSRYKIIDTKEEIVMKPSDIQAIKDEVRAAVENELKNNQIVGSSAPQPPLLNLHKLPSLKEFFENLRLKNNLFSKPKIDEGLFRKAAFKPPEPRLAQPQEEDPFNFLGTFQKVGSALRDSIKSSHETVSHINNVAHSARKALTTSTFALPRVLLPYTTAPVVKSTLFDDNLMMISPRFLDVAEDNVNQPEHSNTYVKMGEIMDAFGMSKPGDDKIGLSRIIIQKKKDNPMLQSRFGEDEGRPAKEYYLISESVDDPDNVESIAVEAFRSLHDIKDMIGVSTIKDFLAEMKREFFTLRKEKVGDDEELNEFLQELFKNKNSRMQEEIKNKHITSRMREESGEETVGAGMNLPPNLFKPFMNQASRNELEDYFRERGDDLNDIELPESTDELQQFLKLTGLVSSINPDIYMRLFNESLSINNNSSLVDAAGLFKFVEKDPIVKSGSDAGVDEEDRRTIMEFHKKLLKPYMGIKIKKGGVDYEDFGQPYQGYFDGFGDHDDGGIL